jgi:hypothetical protein
MINNLKFVQDKEKRKRDRTLIDMALKLDQQVKEQFLYEYLKMCKAKHKLAFFQWRERYVGTSDVDCLKECFEDMVKLSDENNLNLKEMIIKAEHHKIKMKHHEA